MLLWNIKLNETTNFIAFALLKIAKYTFYEAHKKYKNCEYIMKVKFKLEKERRRGVGEGGLDRLLRLKLISNLKDTNRLRQCLYVFSFVLLFLLFSVMFIHTIYRFIYRFALVSCVKLDMIACVYA